MLQPTIPPDHYIVPSEAARLLDVTIDELRKMHEQGLLEKVRFTPGGHRRYNLREVLQARDRQEAPETG
jgi:DNA-binding transcriptional MerR regulator